MIAIIGAGIAGLSLGYELTKSGAQVTVIEKETIASGASGVAACYLEPRLGGTPMRRLERKALKKWPDLVAELGTQTGLDTGFRTAGQLRVSLPEHVGKLEKNTDEREAECSPFQRISAAEARNREPLLSPQIAAAIYLPHVRWVDGKRICAALAKALEKQGGTVLENTGVTAIGHSKVELTGGDFVEAEKIVLCNGMGANALASRPQDVPMARPVRGVNLVLDMSGLPKPVTHMIKHHRGNMVPAGDKRLIVGTTYEAGTEDLEVSDDVVEKLYANAEPVLPGLRDLPLLETNAGLRIKIADGNLRLGSSRENPSVYYSLGHAGSGFLRAPAVAPGLASYILSGKISETMCDIIVP